MNSLLEVTFHLMNDNVYPTIAVITALTVMLMVAVECKNVFLVFIGTVIYTFLGTVALFYIPIDVIKGTM